MANTDLLVCQTMFHVLINGFSLRHSYKDSKGFEPLTWWSEATRTVQAMQRVQNYVILIAYDYSYSSKCLGIELTIKFKFLQITDDHYGLCTNL